MERERAFEELFHLVPSGPSTWWVPPAVAALLKAAPARADEIKFAVIRLLERENGKKAVPGGEQYGEFRAGLIGAVAEFRDRRAVGVLLSNVTTGNMATRGLAVLGAAAVDAVLIETRSTNNLTRVSATRVLSQMLDPALASSEPLMWRRWRKSRLRCLRPHAIRMSG
jgi:hypothetical protein